MLAINGKSDSPLERAAASLVRTCNLNPAWISRAAGLDLAREHYPSGALVSARREAPQLAWLLDGWACEAQELADGRRQIFSFLIAGDVVRSADLRSGRSVRALTTAECVDVGEVAAQPGDCRELVDALIEAHAVGHVRKYDQLARLSWRSPLARMASLLVELHDRLEAVQLVRGGEFPLPLRHEDLADALGLSTLHVTRCLKRLREQQLLTLRFRRVSGFDREGLLQLCSADGQRI